MQKIFTDSSQWISPNGVCHVGNTKHITWNVVTPSSRLALRGKPAALQVATGQGAAFDGLVSETQNGGWTKWRGEGY